MRFPFSYSEHNQAVGSCRDTTSAIMESQVGIQPMGCDLWDKIKCAGAIASCVASCAAAGPGCIPGCLATVAPNCIKCL